MLAPAAPSPAFRFGEKTADPVAMYLSDIFTIPCSLAGLCALSLPAGASAGGLPIGMQLISKPFNEPGIFKLGPSG
ncbi:MAG: hypothetical protein KKH28_05475 [Elusimicrobia bacterium]|nr:hypothetical protein [Elusimicrobiota bacterium]